MGTTASMSWLAQHWFYLEAVVVLRASLANPEGRPPGPGMGKQALVDHLMAHQRKIKAARKVSRPTMLSYVQAAVRFGLLDAAGNGRRRRYYPPGYLRNERERVRASVRELAKLAKGDHDGG